MKKMQGQFRKAFTMAEILLSMTIIGVISALVLPTVTNGTTSKQFLVTYKKAISVLNQSVDTNLAMSGWDFAGTRENYSTAVASILTNRVGATEDAVSWTITGTGGYGFNDTCTKNGYAAEGASCFSTSQSPYLVVNSSNASDPKTKVYTMKDGLASIIMLGDNFGTSDQIPCRAAGQRTVNPVKDATTGVTSLGYSTAANYCLAYLDVNGSNGPNQIVACASSDNVNSATITSNLQIGDCVMTMDDISDVFPVIIYGDTVAPATSAALAALQERFSE